jgi:hypothetical protein
MRESRGIYGVFVEKPGGKRPLGRTRRRGEDHIKMDVQEVGWGECTGLIWLRKAIGGGTCECGNEPSGSIKFGNFLTG